MKLARVLGLIGAVYLAGCSAADPAADSENTEAEGALTDQLGMLGAMDFRVEGDDALTVSLRTQTPYWWQDADAPIRVTLKRAGVGTEDASTCTLSRPALEQGETDSREHRITCGMLEIVRKADRYTLRLSEWIVQKSWGKYSWSADDRIVQLTVDQPRRLEVTGSTGIHPFAVADRIEEALASIAGANYRPSPTSAGPVRGAVAWQAPYFRLQPQLEYGDASPFHKADECISARRPSLYEDPYKPQLGLASARDLADRYRKHLDQPAETCY